MKKIPAKPSLPKPCTSLPDDYVEVFRVDPMEPKLAARLNLSAAAVTLCTCGLALGLYPFHLSEEGFLESLRPWIVFGLIFILYLPAHELIHGLLYRVLTHHRLTFGFNGQIAWCGVPDLYVPRKQALISLSGPLVVFSILFALPLFLPLPLWIKSSALLLLGTHLGSCSGDLYDLWLLLFRFRSPQLLILDPGPVQLFYLPQKQAPRPLIRDSSSRTISSPAAGFFYADSPEDERSATRNRMEAGYKKDESAG